MKIRQHTYPKAFIQQITTWKTHNISCRMCIWSINSVLKQSMYSRSWHQVQKEDGQLQDPESEWSCHVCVSLDGSWRKPVAPFVPCRVSSLVLTGFVLFQSQPAGFVRSSGVAAIVGTKQVDCGRQRIQLWIWTLYKVWYVWEWHRISQNIVHGAT